MPYSNFHFLLHVSASLVDPGLRASAGIRSGSLLGVCSLLSYVALGPKVISAAFQHPWLVKCGQHSIS